MEDSETSDLLKKLLEQSEAQVALLTAMSAKLDEINQGIATVADGVIG
jgi:hypothetical protein